MSGTANGGTKKKSAPKKVEEKTINITMSDLNEMIKNAVEAGQGSAPQPQVINQPQMNTGNVVSNMSQQFAKERRAMDTFISRMAVADADDLVPVKISRVYRPYLPSLKVGLNGAVIVLKPDGITRYVHKDFKPIIDQKIEHIDRLIDAMEDSSEYANIMEYRR